MSTNAYIKLVPSSSQQTITTKELKSLFSYYKEITSKTGKQLGWEYESSSFPYEINETEKGKGSWFSLESYHDRYHVILIGVDVETVVDDEGNPQEQTYIQITLPDSATFGDKGKANEFCKFIGKKLKGELHLFNGRIMYYYPRK
jgi:hypothetical protein